MFAEYFSNSKKIADSMEMDQIRRSKDWINKKDKLKNTTSVPLQEEIGIGNWCFGLQLRLGFLFQINIFQTNRRQT